MSLQIMVGIPGSGKSTIARNLLRDGEVDGIVCPDSIREVLIASKKLDGDPYFNASIEPEVWEMTFNEVDKSIKAGKNILVDATNLTRKARQPWLSRAFDGEIRKIELIAHFVRTPFDVCLKRNFERERIVPLEIMLQMRKDAHNLDTLTLAWEGFDTISYGNVLY